MHNILVHTGTKYVWYTGILIHFSSMASCLCVSYATASAAVPWCQDWTASGWWVPQLVCCTAGTICKVQSFKGVEACREGLYVLEHLYFVLLPPQIRDDLVRDTSILYSLVTLTRLSTDFRELQSNCYFCSCLCLLNTISQFLCKTGNCMTCFHKIPGSSFMYLMSYLLKALSTLSEVCWRASEGRKVKNPENHQ